MAIQKRPCQTVLRILISSVRAAGPVSSLPVWRTVEPSDFPILVLLARLLKGSLQKEHDRRLYLLEDPFCQIGHKPLGGTANVLGFSSPGTIREFCDQYAIHLP